MDDGMPYTLKYQPSKAINGDNKTAGGFVWQYEGGIQERTEVDLKDFEKVKNLVLKEIEIFEKTYSRFLENSQISTLNSQRYLQNPTQELLYLIQIGLYFYHKTDGYFNPILGGVLEDLGYDKDYSFALKNQDKIIDGNFEKDLFQQVSNPKDFVVFEANKISFVGKGNWDLGGYGKGFLIDKIGAILEETVKKSTRSN
jgi:thiamine biosynthesis lipoprotein